VKEEKELRGVVLEADNKKRKRKSSRRKKKERCKGLSIKPNYPKEK